MAVKHPSSSSDDGSSDDEVAQPLSRRSTTRVADSGYPATPHIEPDEIDHNYERIIQNVRDGKFDWAVQQPDSVQDDDYEVKRAAFEDDYTSFWRAPGPNGMTIVHKLGDISIKETEIPRYTGLLRQVFSIEPGLYKEEDDDEKNALHYAIHKGRAELVQLICNTSEDATKWIKMPLHRSNCLHLAIVSRQMKSLAAMSVLIEKSDTGILSAGDADGNTPLHLALKHKHFVSRDFQNKLVEMLVKKHPGALKIKNSDAKELTPFLSLKESWDSFRAAESAAKSDSLVYSESRSSELRPSKKDMYRSRERDREERKESRREDRRDDRRDDRKEERKSGQTQAKYTGRSRDQPSRRHRNDQQLSVDQKLTTFHDLESWLKLFILQHFSHSEALELLYGPVPGGKSIAFNLLNVNSRLSPKDIMKKFTFLDFENILQHVALPNLLPSTELPAATDDANIARARANIKPTLYKDVFEWLRGKNVSKVLEIIVEDDLEFPHDDDTIIDTLRRFGEIRTWNWRKYDLCIGTILKAAPHIETLHLYATGNNAVLEGWSDESGLITLQRLKKVVLSIRGYRNDYTSRVMDEFQRRLDSLVDRENQDMLLDRSELEALLERKTRKIRLDDIKALVKGVPKPLSKQRRIEVVYIYEKEKDLVGIPKWFKRPTRDQHKANKWLGSVKDTSRLVASSGVPNLQRIKVAIIDDGVDASHSTLSRNIKEGITYCVSTPNNSHIPSSFYSSATGHGTLMAALICDMCPGVELYVAKLNDQNAESGYSFTAESAANAVTWAVSKGVDIISMSWTLEDSLKIKDDLTALDLALQTAANENILMFCAARDEGLENPTNKPYPAKSTAKKTVVGAAGPSGAISTWVNFDSIDLLFPGLEIRSAREDLMPLDMTAVDGSSTATACASGLAALLLHILSGDTAKAWSSEGRHDKIQKIMKSVAGHAKYVQVWDLFDEFVAASKHDAAEFQKLVNLLIYKA